MVWGTWAFLSPGMPDTALTIAPGFPGRNLDVTCLMVTRAGRYNLEAGTHHWAICGSIGAHWTPRRYGQGYL